MSQEWLDALLPSVTVALERCRECPFGVNTTRGFNLAGRQSVHKILEDLISVLFPGCHGMEPVGEDKLDRYVEDRLRNAALLLKDNLHSALQYQCNVDHGKECTKCGDCGRKAEEATATLMKGLPGIQQVLQQDIVAAYEGDPAARSTMEVVMSYPGLFAIIVHRIAHNLYLSGVPLIPRIMAEHAHSLTGIDIHPGARIGPAFFIDHGTGVVIGETCVIGRNVKIYQGVTLGALSFEKDEQGNPIKGVKRHPDVGDNVVLYAGATILGGRTLIGENSVIGGNVWLTHSVPPNSKVYNQQPSPVIHPVGEG